MPMPWEMDWSAPASAPAKPPWERDWTAEGGAPPETDQPGFFGVMGQAGVRGLREGLTSVAEAPTAFRDRPPEQPPQDYVGKLLQTPFSEGWKHRDWWAAQIAYGASASSPSLALGAAGAGVGTMAGGGPETPVGVITGLAGGAAGFGLGAMVQEVAPAYQRARQAGLDHDAAVSRAIAETGIAGVAGSASGLLPGVGFLGRTAEGALKRPISEALLQIFGAQPAVGVAQTAATAGVEGRMPTADELAGAAVSQIGVGATLAGAHAAFRAAVPGKAAETPPASDKPWERDWSAANQNTATPPDLTHGAGQLLTGKTPAEIVAEGARRAGLDAPATAPPGQPPPPPPPPSEGPTAAEIVGEGGRRAEEIAAGSQLRPEPEAAQAAVPPGTAGTEAAPAERAVEEGRPQPEAPPGISRENAPVAEWDRQNDRNGVPFMITRDMREMLRSLDYSDEAIADMTPAEAHDILWTGTWSKEPSPPATAAQSPAPAAHPEPRPAPAPEQPDLEQAVEGATQLQAAPKKQPVDPIDAQIAAIREQIAQVGDAIPGFREKALKDIERLEQQRQGAPPAAGLVAAIRDGNGVVYYGRRGDLHPDVAARAPSGAVSEMGFAGPDGRFLTRAEASAALGLPTSRVLPGMDATILNPKSAVGHGEAAFPPVEPKPQKLPPVPRAPQSLAQYLVSKGGINPTDPTGELAKIEGIRDFRYGKKRDLLLRPKGLSLSDAARSAEDAGYLPTGSDAPELIAALRREIHDRQPVYTEEGQLAAAERAERDQLLAEIDRMGGGDASRWNDREIEAFFKRHADEAAAAAINEAGERQAGDLIDSVEDERLGHDAAHAIDLDLGWTDYGLSEDPADLFDERRRPPEAAQGRAPAAEDAARASNPGQAVQPPVETVDNVIGATEQYVIPGAEKISDRELAERRGAAPKRATKPQKPAEDLPLFGGESKQGSLFEPGEEKKPPAVSDYRATQRPPEDRTDDFDDFRRESEGDGVEPGVIARAYVLDRAKDGNEHMVVLGPDGSTIGATTNGMKNWVSFNKRTQVWLLASGANIDVHHNHPSGMSFSSGDIGILGWPGAGAIFAHTERFGSYATRLAAGMREWLGANTMGSKAEARLVELHEAAKAVLLDRILALAREGGIDNMAANLAYRHLAIRALHEAGVLDYSYHPGHDVLVTHTPGLDEALAAAVRDVHMALNSLEVNYGPRPNRDLGGTGDHGPAGDMAGVPGRAGAPGEPRPEPAPAAAVGRPDDRSPPPARRRNPSPRNDPRQLKLLEPPEEGFTRLYRVEPDIGKPGKPDLSRVPEWLRSRIEAHGATGRWFAADQTHLPFYQQDIGDNHRIVHVDVPTGDLDRHRVSNNPAASRHSLDPENEFFLPRELAAKAQRVQEHGPGLPDEDEERFGAPPRPPGSPPGGGGVTPPLGPGGVYRQLSQRLNNFLQGDLVNSIVMSTAPMGVSTASHDTRALPKVWANADRAGNYEWNRVDRNLVKLFPQVGDRQFLDKMDEQSVAVQRGQLAMGEVRRGIGWGSLTPEQLQVAQQFDAYARGLVQQMIAVKMLPADFAGIPHWTPRQLVRMVGGVAERVGGERGTRGLDRLGQNIRTTTPHTKQRKYETREETEAAAQLGLGPDVALSNDIRAMAVAMHGIERAINGRRLVDGIKEVQKATGGDPTVIEGAPRQGYFTIDGNPAFTTYRARTRQLPDGEWETVRDETTGKTITDKVPLSVRDDFKGPLLSIMSKKNPEFYNALMRLKSSATSAIMIGPMIHNMVVLGKAIPLFPFKAFGPAQLRGHAALRDDPERLRQLFAAGFNLMGRRGYLQEISDIANEAQLQPGRGYVAKALRYGVGRISPEAGDTVARWIDGAGDFWHNRLLWDRIADLQTGLALYHSEYLMRKNPGMDQFTADSTASHLANRIVGALPLEAMSRQSRMLTNLLLFSRTFNISNLGIYKDVFTGLPKDTQATILQNSGELARQMAVSAGRRNAAHMIMMDIGLKIILGAAVQSAVNVIRGQSVGDELQGYVDRLYRMLTHLYQSPLDVLDPVGQLMAMSPQAENEPGYGGVLRDRVYLGNDADGRGLYMRLPIGKVAEDMIDVLRGPSKWFELFQRKEGTMVRPTMQALMNDKGFGQKLYDPNDRSVLGMMKATWAIAQNYLTSQLPMPSVTAAYNTLAGKATPTEVMKGLAPLGGFTLSSGHPKGPAAGEMASIRDSYDFRKQGEMPSIRDAIRQGDIAAAVQSMHALHMSSRQIRVIISGTVNPTHLSASQVKEFYRIATPDERAAFNRLR